MKDTPERIPSHMIPKERETCAISKCRRSVLRWFIDYDTPEADGWIEVDGGFVCPLHAAKIEDAEDEDETLPDLGPAKNKKGDKP